MSKPSCINAAYNELQCSIVESMTWTPKIRFLSTHLRITDNKVYLNPSATPSIDSTNDQYNCTNTLTHNNSTNAVTNNNHTNALGINTSIPFNPNSNLVDIVHLQSLCTTKSSLDKFVSVLNYPANAIYQFEGFNGIADKAKLTSFIISTAQQDGTSLMTLTSQKQTSSRRLYNIIFSCIHHRKNTNVSKMCFKDDQLQATGTIRGREHQIKSVKGSSRCSKNSFANTTKDSISKNGIVKKMNRIRPTSSDKQCLFKLTVFLSQQDNKWYVSKFSDRMKSSLSHTNHNQLSGDDLCTHLKTIDDHVRKKVADLFDTGASNNAIANIINMEYDIGINVQQIQNFKDDRIREIMSDYEKKSKIISRQIACIV